MRIENTTKGTLIASKASAAATLLSRLLGLIPRNSLEEGEGLVITRCRSIHMFFMKFPIDAVFIDGKNTVVGLVPNLKPFRLSPVFWKARFVIELPAGVIQKSRTSCGDTVAVTQP